MATRPRANKTQPRRRGAACVARSRRARTLTLDASGDGVAFAMHEVFSGLLSPLIEKSIPDLQPAFDEFAAALKRRAEASA